MLTKKALEGAYKFFITLNSSVRGPFAARWWPRGLSWVRALTALLRDDVALAGLAINCPDGVGRKIPHVMSMVMVFTDRARELGVGAGVFDCAKTYEAAITHGAKSQAQIHMMLGLALSAVRGNHKCAESHLQVALAIKPDLAQAHMALATLAGPVLGRWATAVVYAGRAARLNGAELPATIDDGEALRQLPAAREGGATLDAPPLSVTFAVLHAARRR